MNNQAIELREGDVLVGGGTIVEAVRREGWVRVTVQPAEGTPVCFDIPSNLVIETERAAPVNQKQDLPWNDPKGPKKSPPKKNPTPIPVRQKAVSPTSSPTGVPEALRQPTSAPVLSTVDAPEWTI